MYRPTANLPVLATKLFSISNITKCGKDDLSIHQTGNIFHEGRLLLIESNILFRRQRKLLNNSERIQLYERLQNPWVPRELI